MLIAILNTGCANISSVKHTIHMLGYDSIVSCDYNTIINTDKLIIPGIGTSSLVMNNVNAYKLSNIIATFPNPILGICIGMQLMCLSSKEDGSIKALGIIENQTEQLTNYGKLIPHIGWNKVVHQSKNFLFKDIENGSCFYFVHSYNIPLSIADIATSIYGDLYTAAFNINNYYGVQFHPEKSGKLGMILLRNFIAL
ncbi:imidazole glycerol phosphate synthase subunit HisH [Candidatus Tremblaya phenacola]|uniref:Imidazole glycerol phosphate synthase subunit HisH n=1 Tax=Candidatus Tremblayella phenacoccinincola TaxID=1010676 RepID=A0A2G0V6Z5_9PROT|nr:imidazole glycerol phosphate synthase subunit HisH [Candidatus Tremblaya phenacola]PHN16230.1 Imidazole glycerol phosphate synthase subunit HisH [Candidatus Tremblaya phenacola]